MLPGTQLRIKLGGEERAFEFGAALFFLYEQETGKPSGVLIEQVIALMVAAEGVEASGGQRLEGFALTPMVEAAYYAMAAAADLSGEPFAARKIQVAAWLGNSLEIMLPIMAGFVQGIPRASDGGSSAEAKKKPTRPNRTG